MAIEILFKAKRTDNGEWVEGSLITGVFYRLGQDIPYIFCPKEADYDCFEDFSEENGIFEAQPDTICQYTGLTDKNGKKIWENDIVVHSYRRYEDSLDYPLWKSKVHKKNYAIKWDSTYSYCGFRYHNGRNIFPFKNGTVINGNDEVIGNIFDNPELLGGGE